MSISQLRDAIPDFGKDIRLNLESVLTEEGAPGLTAPQLWSIALASAFATKSEKVVRWVVETVTPLLSSEALESARAAATIMGMNNVYYRFLHLSEDKELSKLPAKLRMNIIGKPGVPKVDFELMSLAVSALSGCGMCINAHVAEVRKAGISNEGIQSTVRIAAVLNATAQALAIAG